MAPARGQVRRAVEIRGDRGGRADAAEGQAEGERHCIGGPVDRQLEVLDFAGDPGQREGEEPLGRRAGCQVAVASKGREQGGARGSGQRGGHVRRRDIALVRQRDPVADRFARIRQAVATAVRLGIETDAVDHHQWGRSGIHPQNLHPVELSAVGRAAADADVVRAVRRQLEGDDLFGDTRRLNWRGGDHRAAVGPDEVEDQVLLVGRIEVRSGAAGSIGVLRAFEIGIDVGIGRGDGIRGNDPHRQLLAGGAAEGVVVEVGAVVDAQPLPGGGRPGDEGKRRRVGDRVVGAERAVDFERIAVVPLVGIHVVELRSTEAEVDEGLHQLRLVDRTDVGEAERVADLVLEDVAQPERVAGDRVVEGIVGVDHHVAVVRVVSVGKYAAVAVDRLPANADVAADSELAPVGGAGGTVDDQAVVVRLIDKAQSGDCREVVEDRLIDGEPRLGGGVAGRAAAVDCRHPGAQAAGVGRLGGIGRGDRGAVRHNAPGQGDRQSLDALAGAVGGGAGPAVGDPQRHRIEPAGGGDPLFDAEVGLDQLARGAGRPAAGERRVGHRQLAGIEGEPPAFRFRQVGEGTRVGEDFVERFELPRPALLRTEFADRDLLGQGHQEARRLHHGVATDPVGVLAVLRRFGHLGIRGRPGFRHAMAFRGNRGTGCQGLRLLAKKDRGTDQGQQREKGEQGRVGSIHETGQ